MSYVYIQTERNLWTVGFYDPDGEWHAYSDYGLPSDAAERVEVLNGDGISRASYKLHESRGNKLTEVKGALLGWKPNGDDQALITLCLSIIND